MSSIFRTSAANKRRAGSHFALAIALATAGAVGVTSFAEPAYAQKKQKADYSKGFISAYQPVADLTKAETPDIAAIKAGLPAVKAAVETADDRMAAGSIILQAGQIAQDASLQFEGLELMLASDKLEAEKVPLYNFLAGQLAFNAKEYAKSRNYIQTAYDLGYRENDPQLLIAQSYFVEDNYAEGVKYLNAAIEARQAAGEPVDKSWIQAGLAAAYNNDLAAQAQEYARLYVTEYPSNESWGDAIAIMLNTSQYEYPEILDLMRLARRADALRDAQLYKEYLEAADPRRLPGEVVAVIDEGYAKGKLDRSDTLITDWYNLAKSRSETDRADLPVLASEARAAGATVKTVVAAGDAFLNYGQAAEAEEFYAKAAGMAGANTPLVLTRLGIAQLDQGKYAEAEATFNKVEGARQAITNLWSIHATQASGG